MLPSKTTQQHKSASLGFVRARASSDSDIRQLQEESQSEVIYRLDQNVTSLIVGGQNYSNSSLDTASSTSQFDNNLTMSSSEPFQDSTPTPTTILSPATSGNVTSIGANDVTSGGVDTPEGNSTEQISSSDHSYTAMGAISLRFSLLYPDVLAPGYIETVSDILRELLCLDRSVELADPVRFDDLDMSSQMDYVFACQVHDEILESQSNGTNLVGSDQRDYGAIIGSTPVNFLQSPEYADPFTFYLWQVRYSVWDIGPEFWSFAPEQATPEQAETIVRQDAGFENVFIRSAVTNINDALQISLDKSITLGIMDDKLQSTLPGFYASVVGKEAMTFSRLTFPVDESIQTYTKFEPESNFLQIFGVGLFLVHTTAMVIVSVLGRRRRKRIAEQEINTESNENHNGGEGCLNTQEGLENMLGVARAIACPDIDDSSYEV